MRNCQNGTILVLLIIISVFFTTQSVFAFKTGAPSSKDGQPPYGLNVEGQAAGDKLNGVIQISFFDLACYQSLVAEGYPCPASGLGPNGAKARVAMRLSRTNTNSPDDTKSFYVELPSPVSIDDGSEVQLIIAENFEELILDAFFEGNTLLNISLKEFSLISQTDLSNWAPPEPVCTSPYNVSDAESEGEIKLSYDGSPYEISYFPGEPVCVNPCMDASNPGCSYPDFTVIADIILAIK